MYQHLLRALASTDSWIWVWHLSPCWSGSTPQPLVEYVPFSLLLAHNTLSSLQILTSLKCCWLHSHLHDQYQVASYSDSSSHVERRNKSGNQANYQVCTIILCYWLNSCQHTLCIWVLKINLEKVHFDSGCATKDQPRLFLVSGKRKWAWVQH